MSRRGRRSGRWGRRSHRAENHEAVQAEAQRALNQRIPDHPLIPAGEPELIEDDLALREFVEHIREAGSFAYDTEFIGEETYYPKLCVVQLSTAARIALVDPLRGVDLEPVWRLSLIHI